MKVGHGMVWYGMAGSGGARQGEGRGRRSQDGGPYN
jgi:hypothetical protein